jgi:hypothetical protein
MSQQKISVPHGRARLSAGPANRSRRNRTVHLKESAAPGNGKTSRKRKPPAANATRRWSAAVTRHSNALDLASGVFTWADPKRIAASLKHSAETSKRKKTNSFRSALSMLTFYINRAGKNLPAQRRRILMRAKDELRKQFGRA